MNTNRVDPPSGYDLVSGPLYMDDLMLASDPYGIGSFTTPIGEWVKVRQNRCTHLRYMYARKQTDKTQNS